MKTGTITLAAALLATFAGTALAQETVTINADTTNTNTVTTTNNGTNTNTTNTTTTDNLSLPTKSHGELITSMIGRWQTTTKFWTTPEAEPATSTGITTMTAAMGGRFVKQEFSAAMGGTSFKGTGYFGFNTANQQLESFWIDNLSTGMLMSTGQRQNDGSIVWTATYTDENGQTQTAKSVTRFPSKNTIVFESYEVASTGTEFKTMEVTYTRAGQVSPAGNNRLSFNNNTITNKTANNTTTNTTNTTNTTGTTTTTTTTDASQSDNTTTPTEPVPQ